MGAWDIIARKKSKNINNAPAKDYEGKVISDLPTEFCNSLQSALQSQVGGKIAQILFQDFYPKLKDMGENNYISSRTRNDILELLDDEFIERKLSSITPKLKGIITDENAKFINSLMLDNKFSAEVIISQLKSFLENYENVLDVESDAIFPLGENLFAFKNSQGFYEIVYKNIQSKTVRFRNHPNFLKVPTKHSNNIFSACTENGGYIFKIVPENIFGEDGDFTDIKHHFFENVCNISELHFDEQTQESFIDVKYSYEEQENDSSYQIHGLRVINSQFEQKDFLNNNVFKEIEFLNGVIICSDSKFLNEGTHSFYSLKEEKLLELEGTFDGKGKWIDILSIKTDNGEFFIEIRDGNIYQINSVGVNIYFGGKGYFGQGLNLFLTNNGKIGTYNPEEKKIQYFATPDIKKEKMFDMMSIIIKVGGINNYFFTLGKQKYYFHNQTLYKLKDEFIIKKAAVYERKWKYFSGKQLRSFDRGFNDSWSQDELNTYLDIVELTDV